jgi:ABC-type bacteriocin/lantibiotic exporter with double-glycine peptidase domain
MPTLNVPYRQQIEESSCGIAAFEMVYKFYRPSKLSKFSQQKMYRKLQEETPDKAKIRVHGQSIVELARDRKFESDWGRVSPDETVLNDQIKFFVEQESIPFIAIQQWHKDPQYGHFRVVIGLEDNFVIFHDPEPDVGGSNLLPITDFLEQWKPTRGGNVNGGVAIWIAQGVPLVTPLLDPNLPNPWAVFLPQ